MTDFFKEEPCDEEPAILENQVKAAIRGTGRNKSQGINHKE